MKAPANTARSFGLSVGTVLLLIAAYSVWRGRITAAEILGGIGTVLVVLGSVRPALLEWPNWLWWKLAFALGWINARIILTIIFIVLLVPLAIIWRLIGRDPLGRRRASWTGWVPYPPRYGSHLHFDRMF